MRGCGVAASPCSTRVGTAGAGSNYLWARPFPRIKVQRHKVNAQSDTRYLLAVSIVGGFALTGLPVVTQADQITLAPVRDTTLSEDDDNYSNGAGPFAFIGTTAGGRRRALLKFALSVLPSGAQMTSTQLKFHVDKNGGGSGVDSAVLHRVLAPWDEGASFATGGGLTQATATDATWRYRVYGAPPAIPRFEWSVLGGDFAPSASAITTMTSIGFYTFSSTSALLADLQGWYLNPADNHGWALLGPEDGRSQTACRISSRESSTAANRPSLIIDYTLAAGSTQTVPLPLWSHYLLSVLLCAAGC